MRTENVDTGALLILRNVKPWITKQQYKTIRGQILYGDADAAMKGLRNILRKNAEELMVIANKRLCAKASSETREVVELMRKEVERECPEFRGLLVPMCEYQGGVCHEMNGCER